MSQPYGASRINRGGLPMASVGPSRHGTESRIHFLEFAEQSFDVDAMNANAMHAETTNADVVDALTSKARQLSSEAGGELERCCWMVVEVVLTMLVVFGPGRSVGHLLLRRCQQ